MASISRQDRLADLVALALIVAGILLYVDGTARLRAISRLSYQAPGPPGIRQLDVADRARYEANAGIALALLGIGAGGVAAARVRLRTPRA